LQLDTLAVAILAGDENSAKHYLKILLEDERESDRKYAEKMIKKGKKPNKEYLSWLETVNDAFNAGYTVNSEDMKVLALTEFELCETHGRTVHYNRLSDLGDLRDDVIYPYMFQKALDEVSCFVADSRGDVPPRFSDRIKEFETAYPDLWANPPNQIGAAVCYFRDGQINDAAILFFNNRDIDRSSLRSIPRIDTQIDSIEGYYIPRTNLGYEDDAKRDYYYKAGEYGYMALALEFYYLNDYEKSYEYAKILADEFPGSRHGLLSRELANYIERSEDIHNGK
jgi:hypothetical protein